MRLPNYRVLVGFGRFAPPPFSLTKKKGGVVQTSEIISSFHFPVVFFVEAVTFQMNAGKNPYHGIKLVFILASMRTRQFI